MFRILEGLLRGHRGPDLGWRRAIVPVAAAAAIAAATAAVYAYHSAASEEMEAKMELYRSYADSAEAESVVYAKKQARDASVKELEAGLLDAARPSAGAALLQEAFKGLASKSGVTVTSGKVLPHAVAGRYVKVPVEFQFRAGLKELKELLQSMDGAPVLMGVRAIRIKSPEGAGSGRLDVTLQVEGAIRKE